MLTLTVKITQHSNVKCSQSSNNHSWKNGKWKFPFCSSFFHSLFSFTNSSTSARRIRTNCAPNDCSSIRDFSFLNQSSLRGQVSAVYLQTQVAVIFLHPYRWLVTRTTAWKSKIDIRTLYLYPTTDLLLEICARANSKYSWQVIHSNINY